MGSNRSAGFGEMLRDYRRGAALTQEELAERARLSTRAISDLERGVKTSPHLATVRQIADALQLSEEERGELLRATRGRPRAVTAGDGTLTSSFAVTLSSGDPASGIPQHLPVGGFLGSLPSGTLVARGEEMARLLTAVEGVAAGEGKLILIAGEPGIGKTRLAQEVTHTAHRAGFLVAAGRCYQPQQSVPYYPFLDALNMAYLAAPATTRDRAAHRWPYLARLLPDQLRWTVTISSDSPEEQERLLRAVSAFLLALAENVPVLLLLDDLHWADSASLQLLQHLARHTRAGRVLLLGTYRDVEVHPDHSLEATLRDLSREQVMERIVLRRLRESDTSVLIAETLGPLEAEFATLVHRHTDGNPFFTRQVLQALIEDSSIYREDGTWKRREIHEIGVPESVRSVIAQRASRLSPDAQVVLQEASVLGPAFTFDDLLEMKSPSQDGFDLEVALDAALNDATAFGLVRVTGRNSYAFDHALTQQALYASLSPRQRHRLHRAAGDSMEALPERIRKQRAAELAWHFLQGDNEEKAVHYSLLAGDQAESVFAHGEAERHYRIALELAREMDDRGRETEALEKLGVVLKIVGRYEEARELLERASDMHRTAQNLQDQGRVEAQIGLLLQSVGTPEEGIRRLQPLANALAPLGPSHSLALLYAALIRLYDHAGRQGDQMDASQRLLDLARTLGDERLLAEAELHQGVSLMHMGRYDEALRLLESAIPRAERVGDLHTVCFANGFCARVHHGRHAVDLARRYHERAVEVAERLSDPREIAHRAVEAAYFTFLTGDWGRSRAYAEQAVASALELDSLRAFLQPLFTLGELCVYTGAREEASSYLGECVAIAEHLGLVDHLREVQAVLAEQDLLEGDASAAMARILPLLDTPGWEEHLNFLLLVGSARLEAGDLDGAESAIVRAVADTTRQRLPIGLVDALRIQGSIAGRRGAREEAETCLRRAARVAREISYPWGEARVLFESGLVHARFGDPDPASEQLAAASTIFAALGAEPYRARAVRAIEALGRRAL